MSICRTTSSRAVSIQATRFIAKVNGAPGPFIIPVDGASATLNFDAPGADSHAWSRAFRLRRYRWIQRKAFRPRRLHKLEEMIVVVSYGMKAPRSIAEAIDATAEVEAAKAECSFNPMHPNLEQQRDRVST
jgi:hypothetical protein